MEISLISYSSAVIAYFILTVLLFTAWKGRVQGGVMIVAVLASFLWSLSYAIYYSPIDIVSLKQSYIFEYIRSASWLVFLFLLFKPLRNRRSGQAGVVIAVLCVLIYVFVSLYSIFVDSEITSVVSYLVLLWSSLASLILIEILIRNTKPDQRWAVKPLFLGLGAVFVYDFVLYANAVMFGGVDETLWDSRGFVYAISVPLLAVSAARNPKWSLNVFISREVVLHTSSVIVAGMFLIMMAAAGYYVKLYGGEWGDVFRILVFFSAAIIFVTVLVSGRVRARIKVFISKNFFENKYNYREEWLRFVETISASGGNDMERVVAIRALAQIVDSSGAQLWQKNDGGNFEFFYAWNMPEMKGVVESNQSPFIAFLSDKKWIVDLSSSNNDVSEQNIMIPSWLEGLPHAWLVVPLIRSGELTGFILLSTSKAPRKLDWEDYDIIKTASSQAANYLALINISEELAQSKQFEAFNRLSAYVVHDLKNLVAQLSLIVKNSVEHKGNPEFVEDVVLTVDNVVNKMNKLLYQLRKGSILTVARQNVDLVQVVQQVVGRRSVNSPIPVIAASPAEMIVYADKDRLEAVIEHIVQNAQEATDDNGIVTLSLEIRGGLATICVQDNGQGMTADFIRERLFKPFDTTKGNAGMGIGVYESREYFHEHGGDVKVTSDVGVGTEFRMTLPLNETKG